MGKVSSPFLWAGKKQVTIIRHRVNRSFLIAAALSLLMARHSWMDIRIRRMSRGFGVGYMVIIDAANRGEGIWKPTGLGGDRGRTPY